MKKHRPITCLMVITTTLGILWAPQARAQRPDPVSTATAKALETTPEPTSSPTSVPPAAPKLALTEIEPKTMIGDVGGTLSVYGDGFSAASVVRLIGHGLLSTSYLNPTALAAQVPGGVLAGQYDVEVSDGAQRATLQGGLTVLAPTPTPQPASPAPPPPPGRPILTLRNYTVEPAQVRPGHEFVVTIEVYNNGSRAGENTLAVFPGDPFLPVGEPGRMLGQIHINHLAVITQRMRVPSSLGSGIHQLVVSLGTNDWEGNHYDYPQQIPVEVIGGGGSRAPVGRPRLVIEGASTEPASVTSGGAFSLTLQLANLGTRTALDIFVSADPSEIAIPAVGSGKVSIDPVQAGEGVTVTLPLLIADVAAGGRQILPVNLEYADAGGGTYSEAANVGVNVDAGLSRRPQLVITEYATEPDFVTPGDTFTVTIHLANVGGGAAERLTLALGGEGGANLEPFIPVGAGNVVFVPEIGAGASTEIARRLVVDGSAAPKAYNLPVALGYDDVRGSRQEDVQRLSLVVRRLAELQATFYQEPESMTVGSPVPLSLELINVGLGSVNVVEVTASSPKMEIEAEGAPFMGPVEIGGSAPLDVTVTPREGGPAEIVISVLYRDDFNQIQELKRTLTVEVDAGPPGLTRPTVPGVPGQAEQTPATETMWQKIGRAIRGFLGFGS
jgi:hypothetical protein